MSEHARQMVYTYRTLSAVDFKSGLRVIFCSIDFIAPGITLNALSLLKMANMNDKPIRRLDACANPRLDQKNRKWDKILSFIWLDEDTGLHKEICHTVHFPNTRIINIESLYSRLISLPGGTELIEKLKVLKGLKGVIF
jgi:hypothetical protein